MISANGLMVGDAAPATVIDGPVTKDTFLTVIVSSLIAKATTLTTGSSRTPVASMLGYLKNFTCYIYGALF